MKETYVTIAEFARLAGVSRQAVYSRLDCQELDKFIQVDNSGSKPKKLVSTTALKLFKQKDCCQVDSQVDKEKLSSSDKLTSDLTSLLKDQLTEKDKQLKEKDNQLKEKDKQIAELQAQVKEMTRLLDQGQQLQAMTQKLLAAPKSEPESEAEPVEPEPKEKKSFFSRLFSW